MRDTIDIYTDGLPHDHNAIELSIDYYKGRGIQLFVQPVEIKGGCRSMILMGNNGAIRHVIEPAKRLNRKKLAIMREKIFHGIDRYNIPKWFKEGDEERIISDVLGSLEIGRAA